MEPQIVRIGIKPLPLTSALVKSDRLLVQTLTKNGYSCVLLAITNPGYRENCKSYFQSFKDSIKEGGFGAVPGELKVPFPRSNEVNIFTGPHTGNTIGMLSPWIELGANDPLINEFSLQVISNEIAYAQFLGIRRLLLAPPKDLNHLAVFTNSLNSILHKFSDIEISISLPICEDPQINPATGELIPIIDPLSTWDMWNTIRIHCNYHRNLTVSLASPKQNIPEHVVNRWLLEPIRFYLISSSRFIPNSKGYPVLNKYNQLIIWKIIQKKVLDPPIILLHGVDKESDLIANLRNSTLDDNSAQAYISVDGNKVYLGDLSFLDYLKYLIKSSSNHSQLLPIEEFTLSNLVMANLDPSELRSIKSLQTPLQPLSENLNNATYKVFEQDQAKYECYERALISSLMDLMNLPRFQHVRNLTNFGATAFNTSSLTVTEKVPDANGQQCFDYLKILVIGPGRGPLIERLFAAIKFLNLNLNKVHITAIEKSPTVMVYLSQRNQDFWNGKVEVVNADVRSWKPRDPTQSGFHLVISELLGSFGCNELSPECLYSVERYCDPDNSIFIPKEYTSFVAPAISPSIYTKLIECNDLSKFHTCYIPLCDEYDTLSSKYSKLWTFRHPLGNGNMKRQAHTILHCHRKGTIHGLLGFFQAELYNGIIISNCPTGSGPSPHNLVSWLPLFMPLEQPMQLTDDQELAVFVKRDTAPDRVWYEWSLESYIYLALTSESTLSRSSNNSSSAINQPGRLSLFSGAEQSGASRSSMESDEYQVRVRTGTTRIHNPNGMFHSMKL
ncbi:hypothetical protein KL930_001449 [Ogataea haglerorum]|uniref:Protein arginine N-methyltransferase n=1 Tax=Ogataea haglerorum TaxID=1937702 RepID=A0AAN6HZP1_9ASCO|nr:uncharacterized protein KL911_003850 [Ogataea haglerorum]KAG7695126.1 hypothetical protein KL915_003359 [Ogataea haglerorum]KAG7698671.1 hypothetical protein KL951_001935 [Ogataea haglerorum]KAG7706450.1 hypothetical protein KL914_003345 [Ogataea haglerorum]KAG7707836.1 hypothetical protein KL950_002462 [Ogataea haglerorum]KAG7724859.1 hypothetical protein KL948_005104 [Ogataea haglerorum]